jgi:hypothetical protein
MRPEVRTSFTIYGVDLSEQGRIFASDVLSRIRVPIHDIIPVVVVPQAQNVPQFVGHDVIAGEVRSRVVIIQPDVRIPDLPRPG